MAKWAGSIMLAALVWQSVPAISAETKDAAAKVPNVVLNADNIFVDEADNTVIAEGNVEAAYEGRVLRADRVVYNSDTQKVRATGNIVIIDTDGSQRFADEIETDSNLLDGFAVGFSTRLAEGAVAAAESAVRTEDGISSLEKIVYTACEMCDDDSTPTWSLRARRAVLDDNTEMMRYRDAVLEIGGVPIVYLPWFAHPDPSSERRSGFLPPDFGLSSKLGLFYQQPYHWVISPHQDITISPLITANVNPVMDIEHRKRFWSGDVRTRFSITNEQDFDSRGEKFGDKEWRGHIVSSGEFKINKNWDWGFGIQQVSDDLYTRRYDISGVGDELGLYEGQPLRLLSQVFVTGQDTNWYADSAFLTLSGLRENDDDDQLPRALPVSFAERLFDLGGYGLVGVNASTALLNREDGIDSYRVSIGGDWETTRVLPGGVLVNPFAESRFDYYNLNDLSSTPNTPDAEINRGIATVGTRVSYPLYRPGKWFDLIVEPEAMTAYSTPGFNDPIIPVEDSIFFEFDESTLFDASAVNGYDLYEGGTKASVGISTTARWKNGVELKVTGGRRWRDTADTTFDRASNLDGTVSDWVAGAALDIGKPLSLETRVRLDKEDWSLNRVDARLKTNFWRLKSEVRYYKIASAINSGNNDDEGVDINSQLQLTNNYYLLYERQRDISGRSANDTARDLSHKMGVAFEDDCSRFELVFERSESIDRTLGPEDSVKFFFSFKTLGSFGSSNVD